MRALIEHPDQRQLLIDDPSLVPGAIEEVLRMFRAFGHFRLTATKDTELNGYPIKQGDKLALWYPSSNRDEDRYEDPDRFDVLRNPEHQAFGAGGRHFCLGTALAPRAEDPRRGNTQPLPEHDHRQPADLGDLTVLQPAQDPPCPPQQLSRTSTASTGPGSTPIAGVVLVSDVTGSKCAWETPQWRSRFRRSGSSPATSR
jgi:hypothetical protein